MTNDKGQKITEAGPSIPVEVFGLSKFLKQAISSML